MRLFVDTNLLVDLYMYFENFVEDVGFRRYITRVLDLLSGNCREVEDILISDVILREFSLKVIGSIIKSRIPIPRELEDRVSWVC